MTTVTVTVIQTDEVTITIPDDKLTPEYLKEFSGYMFRMDFPEDLIKYAAAYVVRNRTNFVEGIGPVEFDIENMDIEMSIEK